MGSILDDARADAVMILSDGGFETLVTFIKPDTSEIEIKGMAIRRTDRIEYMDEAHDKLSPFSSITVPLAPFNFTTTYISFKGWKVKFIDSEKELIYSIAENLPNRTLGIVNITLKDEQN